MSFALAISAIWIACGYVAKETTEGRGGYDSEQILRITFTAAVIGTVIVGIGYLFSLMPHA